MYLDFGVFDDGVFDFVRDDEFINLDILIV